MAEDKRLLIDVLRSVVDGKDLCFEQFQTSLLQIGRLYIVLPSVKD